MRRVSNHALCVAGEVRQREEVDTELGRGEEVLQLVGWRLVC